MAITVVVVIISRLSFLPSTVVLEPRSKGTQGPWDLVNPRSITDAKAETKGFGPTSKQQAKAPHQKSPSMGCTSQASVQTGNDAVHRKPQKKILSSSEKQAPGFNLSLQPNTPNPKL